MSILENLLALTNQRRASARAADRLESDLASRSFGR
jgi:hypothetical protein